MRHQRIIGLVALGTLAASACSGGSAHQIATASGGSSDRATTTTINGDQAFIEYAHCMRDHGVADYPDPVQRPGHNGLSLEYGGDASTPGFEVADGACRHFIQSIIDMKQNSAHDQLTPERLQGLTNYARCMRDHQIPMLDPDPNDGHISLGNVAGIPNNVGRKDPEFGVADAACRSQLPADVPDDGTGPP